MTLYKLGLDGAEWTNLRTTPMEISVALTEGSSTEMEVDTADLTPSVHLDIHHIDVGQGESTLLTLMAGNVCVCSVLIDGGLNVEGGGMLIRMLHQLDIEFLDAVVISHFDEDHFAGIVRVMANYLLFEENLDEEEKKKWVGLTKPEPGWQKVNVQNVFLRADPRDPGIKKTDWVVSLNGLLEAYEDRIHIIEVGDEIKLECDADVLDGVKQFKMTCLMVNATGDDAGNDDDENAASIAWLVQFGRYSYYTAGDLPSTHRKVAYEDSLGAQIHGTLGGPITAIKCGHHGAETCTSAAFLAAVQPRVAFISAGKQERFGHPRGSTLLRLHAQPSVTGVFLTNCVYNRPFVNPDYRRVACEQLVERLGLAAAAVEVLIQELQDIDPDDVDKERERDTARDLVRQRQALEEWKRQAAQRQTTLQELGSGVAANVLQGVQALHVTMTDLLDSKGSLQTGLTKLRYGIGPFKRSVNAKVTKNIKDGSSNAAQLARSILEADVERRENFHALVAGSSTMMGNIVFRMPLTSANTDDRVAFVGMVHAHAWRWYPVVFGQPVGLDVPTDDLLRLVKLEQLELLTPPGSPLRVEGTPKGKRTFGEMTQGRVEHRTDEHVGNNPGAFLDEEQLIVLGRIKRRKIEPEEEENN